MSFREYLSLSFHDRWVIHDELSDLIDRTSPKDDGDGGGIRPKQMRK